MNYKPFAGNRLIRRADVEIPSETNEYGMVLNDSRQHQKQREPLIPTKPRSG